LSSQWLSFYSPQRRKDRKENISMGLLFSLRFAPFSQQVMAGVG
jgi:hypothetical protein